MEEQVIGVILGGIFLSWFRNMPPTGGFRLGEWPELAGRRFRGYRSLEPRDKIPMIS